MEKAAEKALTTGPKKKSRRNRRLLILVLILLAELCVAAKIYMDNHREDWLSKDEALHMALKDAGAKEELVYDVDVDFGLDEELRRVVYRIRFRNHLAEFDYEIDAQSGEFFRRDKTESPA